METVTREHKTFTPQGTDYVEYVDPDTGNKYYTDGNYWFTDLRDPGGSALDWETDVEIIERLKTKQAEYVRDISYIVLRDPVTQIKYFRNSWPANNGKYTSDPLDPIDKVLDPNKAADKAVIDRLESTNTKVHSPSAGRPTGLPTAKAISAIMTARRSPAARPIPPAARWTPKILTTGPSSTASSRTW